MNSEASKPVLVILGPTCAWKSEAAFLLAQHHNGEVISCDSMQIYRGLDIGTAKATPEMRRTVPHHLVDCLDLTERYDTARFVEMAQAAIQDIRQRCKLPIIAGGTGLYARALIYGFNLLPSDHDLALQLRPLIETETGRQQLMNELLVSVKGNLAEIPQDIQLNPRHLLRAIEVLRLTGTVPWKLASKNDRPNPDYRQFCIIPDLDLLKERIRQRTRLMIEAGWINEAITACDHGLLQTPTAHQALGYRDIYDFVRTHHNNGILEELTELLISRTIAYARRQLTWFRHQHPGANIIPAKSVEDVISAIEGKQS